MARSRSLLEISFLSRAKSVFVTVFILPEKIEK